MLDFCIYVVVKGGKEVETKDITMIKINYSPKGTPFVWASDLHAQLAVGTPLSTWFPRMIEYGFEENLDYSRHNKFVESAGSIKKAAFDWAVQIDMAKHIAMMQRTKEGKAIREYLLGLDKKVAEGMLLTHAQMAALFDICRVMGFFSVQVFFENENFTNIFKDKHYRWWDSRAKLFGYSAKDLKEMMQAVGKKYINQRQAILNIDKYELIKIGVYDMFLAMGKSQEFALNVSQFAKSIAEEIKPEIYDDRNTSIDFKSEKQKDVIEDIKNYKTSSSLLQAVLDQRINTPTKSQLKHASVDPQLGLHINDASDRIPPLE